MAEPCILEIIGCQCSVLFTSPNFLSQPNSISEIPDGPPKPGVWVELHPLPSGVPYRGRLQSTSYKILSHPQAGKNILMNIIIITIKVINSPYNY